jgi:hypothetical protein
LCRDLLLSLGPSLLIQRSPYLFRQNRTTRPVQSVSSDVTSNGTGMCFSVNCYGK